MDNIDVNINPVLEACKNGNLQFVYNHLKSKRVNINCQDENGNSPLYVASYFGQDEIVLLLLKNGANVNIKNHYGLTPLHAAVEKNNIVIIKLLLQYAADVNIISITKEGNEIPSPLCYAGIKKNYVILNTILDYLYNKPLDVECLFPILITLDNSIDNSRLVRKITEFITFDQASNYSNVRDFKLKYILENRLKELWFPFNEVLRLNGITPTSAPNCIIDNCKNNFSKR